MADITLDEMRKAAADIAWTGLTDEHLKQLVRATTAARARRAALQIETLKASDEPAHMFRRGMELVR